MGFYEDEDTASSSEEEDYALDASCGTQEGSLPKRAIYRKTGTVQATQLYEEACNEISRLPKRDDRQMYTLVMREQGRDRQRSSCFQVPGSSQRYSHYPATTTQRGSYNQASTSGYQPHQVQTTHQPTQGRNSAPGRAQASGRNYSQQSAGARHCSYHQTQPGSRSYPHHQAQYRNEKRVSSHASKIHILRQNSTKLNKMRSAPQTEECSNRRESAPPPVQHQFPRQRIAVVPRPSDMNTNQDREHQPLRLPVRRTGRQEICNERNRHVNRRIGVCSKTDEAEEHRMFVRVLRKRF